MPARDTPQRREMTMILDMALAGSKAVKKVANCGTHLIVQLDNGTIFQVVPGVRNDIGSKKDLGLIPK